MKPREAIESLKYLISEDCCDTQMDYVDEIEMAIQALEKQVAKRPVDTYNTPPVDLVYCPICSNSLTDQYGWEYEYCPECGQAIDWTEELE